MTADELPLVGPAWGLDNVWIAEGVPGGILWGGAIGYYLSERIVEGGNSIDTSDLDPRRFGDYANKNWTREKCAKHGAPMPSSIIRAGYACRSPAENRAVIRSPDGTGCCLGLPQRLGNAELVRA